MEQFFRVYVRQSWHCKLPLRMSCLLRRLAVTIVMFSSILGGRSVHSEPFVEANTAFALDLYGQLRSTTGNLFFSPYSMSTCLTMTYAGARGDTEKQMRQVLHPEREQRNVSSDFGEVQRQLERADEHSGNPQNSLIFKLLKWRARRDSNVGPSA